MWVGAGEGLTNKQNITRDAAKTDDCCSRASEGLRRHTLRPLRSSQGATPSYVAQTPDL